MAQVGRKEFMVAIDRKSNRSSLTKVAAARNWRWLPFAILGLTGCGMFGGPAQLKQLQAENDKLVSEYRAQRDKVAKLQETNVALEQRVAEAEKLLARSGYNSPSSRLSQVPGRSSASGSGFSSVPPYVPPQAGGESADNDPKWHPLRRQP